MGKKRKQLSHDEIWDDSGLIQSWNDSYEEYKRYHSIHARGESIKDVLAAVQIAGADTPSNGNVAVPSPHHAKDTDASSDGLEEGEVQDDEPPAPATNGGAAEEQVSAVSEDQATAQPITQHQALGLPSVYQPAIEGSTQDQGLKNLMMSWYWSGYYTGLYEGQRAQQPPVNGNGQSGSAA